MEWKDRKLQVVFLHLDLGIGGAEQLVVNAAVSMIQRGHAVKIYTTHHDPGHSFPETSGDGILASCIRVRLDWLPRQVFGRLTALCAALRMGFLALLVTLIEGSSADAFFLDGVSVPIPILRLTGVPVYFFCHFPDKLLCVDRSSFFKRLYRAPLDLLEEVTTGMADTIAVNSKFTAQVFLQAFSRLKGHTAPVVLYPPINLESFVTRGSDSGLFGPIVSLNRFERKKNVLLAVEAVAVLRSQLEESAFAPVKLIIAGGYDPSVTENVQHKKEIEARVKELGLEHQTEILPNISDAKRAEFLRTATCVLYTPDREHFGIVPVEAMYAGSPVVAVASGGPMETVVDGVTGFLRPQTPEAFASAIRKFVEEPGLSHRMGMKGHAHVAKTFSLETFGETLETELMTMVKTAETGSDFFELGERAGTYLAMGAVFIAIIVALWGTTWVCSSWFYSAWLLVRGR